MITLYDYQQALIDDIRKAFAGGHRRVVATLPTGGGKTEVAGAIFEMVRAKGGKPWFVVTQTVLIEQTKVKFERRGLKCGVLMGDQTMRLPDEDCVLASLQTIHARLKGKPNSALLDDCTFMVFDEVHMFHKTHQVLIERFDLMHFIGLTATPLRAGLGNHFTTMVRGPSIGDMIARGRLVPFKCFGPSKPDLAKVGVDNFGDFKQCDLDPVMRQKEIVADVVTTWKRLGENRQTIVFAVTVAHAQELAEEFASSGVPAEVVTGHTRHMQREELFTSFRRGDIRVLVSVGVLALGFDVPDVSCVVQARPTMSVSLHIQQCGRGARLAEGKGDCILIDHAGNCERLGLPQHFVAPDLDDTTTGTKREKRLPKMTEVTPCRECGYLLEPHHRECPKCLAVRRSAADIVVHDGQIVALDSDLAPDLDAIDEYAFFAELKGYARMENARRESMGMAPMKPGYAAAVFKDRTGRWPPKSMAFVQEAVPSPETLRWLKYQRIKFGKGKGKPTADPARKAEVKATLPEWDGITTHAPCAHEHAAMYQAKGPHAAMRRCTRCGHFMGFVPTAEVMTTMEKTA